MIDFQHRQSDNHDPVHGKIVHSYDERISSVEAEKGSEFVEEIYGTWLLECAFAVNDEGESLYPVYGDRPTGYITYTQDGTVMALITHDARPLIEGDRESAPLDQSAAAFRTSIAYAGSFSVDETTITHSVKASTYPNWVGVDLVRDATLSGKHLKLRTRPQMQNGQLTVIDLTWVKHAQADPVAV